MSTGRAALIGAAIALVAVVGLVAAVALHLIPVDRKASTDAVVVASVPGSDKTMAPRTLDVYSRTGFGYAVRSSRLCHPLEC
jgi:hypothetical protein